MQIILFQLKLEVWIQKPKINSWECKYAIMQTVFFKYDIIYVMK